MMTTQEYAFTVLPDCQRTYQASCERLAAHEQASSARVVLSAQTNVGYALRALNTVRKAAGLVPLLGPVYTPAAELVARAYEQQRESLSHLQR